MADKEKSGTIIINKIDAINSNMKDTFINQAAFNVEISKRIDEITVRLSEMATAAPKKTRAPAKEKTEKTEKTEVKQPFPTTAMSWFKRNMVADLTFVDQFIDDDVSKDYEKRIKTDEIAQLPEAKQLTTKADIFWKTYCAERADTKNIVVLSKIKDAYNKAKKEYEQKNKTPASKE